MNGKKTLLAQRRALLVARAASQRQELASMLEPFQVTLGYADRGLNAVRMVTRHPVIVLAAAGAAAYFFPKRWLHPLLKGLLPWSLALISKLAFPRHLK